MWFLSIAAAVTPEALQARLKEVAPLRAQRLSQHAPEVPDSAYTTAASGEVATGMQAVESTSARKVWGVAVLKADTAKYFSAINDDRSKVDYTKLENVELLAGNYCGAKRTVFQRLGVPILADRWWVVDQRINTRIHEASSGRVREMVWSPAATGSYTLNATAQSASSGGVHIEHTYGGWFLVDLGGGETLVEFWSWSEPGGSVPAGMAASFASGSIEDTLQSMAKLANAGPKCSL